MVLHMSSLLMGPAMGPAGVHCRVGVFIRFKEAFASRRALLVSAGTAHSCLHRYLFRFAATRASSDRLYRPRADTEFLTFRKVVSCGTVWVVLSFTANHSHAAILWRLSDARGGGPTNRGN